MERAGAAVAREAMLAFPAARSFACVCGGGSNGGDGRVAARVCARRATPPTRRTTSTATTSSSTRSSGRGSTASRAPRRPSDRAHERGERTRRRRRRALGGRRLDRRDRGRCRRGRAHGHVPRSQGRSRRPPPAASRAGRVVVADIGLEPSPTARAPRDRGAPREIPLRRPGDTKYTAGSVLVVGGQPGMTSAACLTAMAASGPTPAT